MRVLVLSPYPERIAGTILKTDTMTATTEPLDGIPDADFIVSFGYRHIVNDRRIFDHFGQRIINLHIAHLPWNRGADPVFWALHDNTPLGVTIHVMTMGIDTGPILAHYAFEEPRPDWRDDGAVLQLKEKHYRAIAGLFDWVWQDIRECRLVPKPQVGQWSYHRIRDRLELMAAA